MAEDWIPLPLDQPYFANLDEDAVVGFMTAVENGFINELGGHTRFPGLSEFASFGGNSRVYLHDLSGDLIAVTGKGQVGRVDSAGVVEDVTGVPVSGGRRVIFAKRRDDLVMCAGGPIVRLRAGKSELLSKKAPLATHVGWIDGYTIAVEINSGRFYYDDGSDTWDPLDTFAADGNPDNINGLIITPFGELMLGGEKSIEQFERLYSGEVPFFRRWSVGDGFKFSYMNIFADNAIWTINNLLEFVRFSGQTSISASGSIGRLLEAIDDWGDAWIGGFPDSPFHVVGQKFILIQMPKATNPYGTKGLTIVYDYRGQKFFTLYGWDDANGMPKRWPGWSHWPLWNKVFVGGEGKIYQIDKENYRNGSETQRWLIRTSQIAQGNAIQVKDFRLRIKRGLGSSNAVSTIHVRCSRDGKPFGPQISRSLGYAGDRHQHLSFGHFGTGDTFMFEISSTDNCPIDLMRAEVKVDPVGH